MFVLPGDVPALAEAILRVDRDEPGCGAGRWTPRRWTGWPR